MCPPCKPKIRSTPRLLRKRAVHAAQLFSPAPKSFADAFTARSPSLHVSTGYGFGNPALENAMLHLAGHRPRHVLVTNDGDRTRALVASQPLAAPRQEL